MRLVTILKLDVGYLRNIGFQSGGNILAQVINIVSLPIITRLFDPADIGVFNLFMQFMALATILISFRVEHVVMLPKTDDDARELVGFVVGFGIIACVGMTAALAGLSLAGLISETYHFWALILPLASFLVVFAQAAQQLSQRSVDFRRSGMSEIANRAGNSLVSVSAGLLGFPGIWLGIGTAAGFVCKLLVVGRALRPFAFKPIQAALKGRERIKAQSLEKLLGSMILSHGMLAVTALAPLTYIGYRYGENLTGQFALVLGTLALPTTLVGNAVGQVFYQRASQQFANGSRFTSLLLANARMLLFIAVPAFLFVALTGSFLYSFVFGSQWHVAGQTAQIYAVAAALSFMTVPFERSGLIVNAWWYGPSWHFGRLVTTIGVILACEAISASYLTFILLLTIQSGLLYIVDGGASYLFSKRDAKFSSRLRSQ